MSKYTYTPVEHLSDLDITGNTQYYLFEEGVGHKFYAKSVMMKSSLYELDSYIDNGLIFTREEKPWYENIPDKGVLCWDDFNDCYRVITEYISDSEEMRDVTGFLCDRIDLTPLTNEEIKQFLQEEE